MKTHTPGPWNDYEGEVMHDGALIATVMQADDFPCIEDITDELVQECKANGALIAAAPEMLEALKSVARLWFSGQGFSDKDFAAMRDDVKAAIAKAEGK